MIRDVIERFRYRFQLWHRERREDLFGTPRTESVGERDYLSQYSDPKRAMLPSEPTVQSIGRSVIAYFGVIFITAQICLIIVRFIPSSRFAVGVIFLFFVGFWTVGMIGGEIRLRKARKQFRRRQAIESSNQPLEPTTSRSDV